MANAPFRSRFGSSIVMLMGVVLVFASRLVAGRNDAVAISAMAAPGYTRVLADDGKLAPETYVFAEGQYFGGETRDRSLERMTFADLARVLAVNLAAQEYYPIKDATTANLLIRVFWGTTTIYEDPLQEQNIAAINEAMAGFAQLPEDANPDLSGIQNALDHREGMQHGVEGAIARNAALLGYRRALDRVSYKITMSPEELLLRTELNEERYFVVLLAYDYQFMRRERKSKLLWITRLSIRGPGNNFTEALPALALAGAQAYGRDLADLERIKVRDLPNGEVILGDLKVLGVAETPAKQKSEK